MKNNIVLIGAYGKAGSYHNRILSGLGCKIISLDREHTNCPNLINELQDLFHKDKNTIVDICTPTATHPNIIRGMYALGCRKFLVEKPGALSAIEWKAIINDLVDAKFFVSYNYQFSEAFSSAKSYIENNGLTIQKITWVFNKDRKLDSKRGRGANDNGQQPHVFWIEIPHGIAMIHTLLGDLCIVDAVSVDMIVEDIRMIDHGYGAITVTGFNEAQGFLESNLSSGPIKRELRIVCDRNVEILIKFPADSTLLSVSKIVSPHSVTLFEGKDDSLLNSLKFGINFLNKSEPDPTWVEFAYSVLQYLEEAKVVADGTR